MLIKRLLEKYVFEIDASKPLADDLQDLIDHYYDILREHFREFADDELEIIYEVEKIDKVYEFRYEVYTVSDSLSFGKTVRKSRISIKYDDTFNITKAKELLEDGFAVARKEWLGKKYIFLVTSASSVSIYPEFEQADAWGANQDPYLVMRHLDVEQEFKLNKAVYTTGYNLTGRDLFAEDWYIVKKPVNQIENQINEKGE